MKKLFYFLGASALFSMTVACSQKQEATTTEEPAATETTAAENSDEGWLTLFDGETIDESKWIKRGGIAEYHVEDDAIVGTTQLGTPNTFLTTAEEYKDFVLELELMVEDTNMNSGVQIRSKVDNEDEKHPNGKVYGYQIEIDPSARAFSGGLYEEKGRGWLHRLEGDDFADARAAFKVGEWNKYRVESQGQTVKTWVNGVPATSFIDTVDVGSGFIGLQVHSTREEEPMQVRWRNIRIKPM